jgi:hypothetical protein
MSPFVMWGLCIALKDGKQELSNNHNTIKQGHGTAGPGNDLQTKLNSFSFVILTTRINKLWSLGICRISLKHEHLHRTPHKKENLETVILMKNTGITG